MSFNVVTSSDHLVGEELTLSPLVDMISFTGSTVTGKRIMEKGAATMKRVFLELGGKSAMIVLDDADFATAVPSGSMVCMHAGQGCAMQTRMLLPRSRYDEGVELITQAMSMVPYGDPSDPNVMMGPLISAKQRDRVLGYIAKGQEEGAKLVLGGGRPAQFPKGYCVEPTLFVDVDNSMTIAQEEIFGPVLGRDPVRGRRRRRAHRQRQRLRPLGWRALGRTRRGRRPSPGASVRGRSASTAACGTAPTRPSADTRPAASAARTVSKDSSSTSRRRPSPGCGPDRDASAVSDDAKTASPSLPHEGHPPEM